MCWALTCAFIVMVMVTVDLLNVEFVMDKEGE